MEKISKQIQKRSHFMRKVFYLSLKFLLIDNFVSIRMHIRAEKSCKHQKSRAQVLYRKIASNTIFHITLFKTRLYRRIQIIIYHHSSFCGAFMLISKISFQFIVIPKAIWFQQMTTQRIKSLQKKKVRKKYYFIGSIYT